MAANHRATGSRRLFQATGRRAARTSAAPTKGRMCGVKETCMCSV